VVEVVVAAAAADAIAIAVAAADVGESVARRASSIGIVSTR